MPAVTSIDREEKSQESCKDARIASELMTVVLRGALWKHVKNKEQLRYNADSESKKDR